MRQGGTAQQRGTEVVELERSNNLVSGRGWRHPFQRVRRKSLTFFVYVVCTFFWGESRMSKKNATAYTTYAKNKRRFTPLILLRDLHPKKRYTRHAYQKKVHATCAKNKNERCQPFSDLRRLCGHFQSSFVWGRHDSTSFVATWIAPFWRVLPEGRVYVPPPPLPQGPKNFLGGLRSGFESERPLCTFFCCV